MEFGPPEADVDGVGGRVPPATAAAKPRRDMTRTPDAFSVPPALENA